MDYDKLIETLRQHGVSCVRAYGRYCSICDEAATALSTLQAENERLRAELERTQQGQCAGCSVPVVNAESLRDLQDAPKLRAELEKVKAERDAAVSDMEALMWFSGEGCRICAHAIEVHKEPYVRLDCNREKGTDCCPKWRGPQKED